jgi:Domain of unknown function (DUF4258)
VKPIRWTPHAVQNLLDREIDRSEVDKALSEPNGVAPVHDSRGMYMRLYSDETLNREMLLCVIVEETETESVVVTVFKTSRIARYLGRAAQ